MRCDDVYKMYFRFDFGDKEGVEYSDPTKQLRLRPTSQDPDA